MGRSNNRSDAITALVAKVDNNVEQRKDEIIAFLQELVQAESPAPPGDTRQAAAVCCAKAKTFTDNVRLVAVEDRLPSVLVEMGEGPLRLLFNSHIDTVPVGEASVWRYPPFSGLIVDGVLHGRGAGDAKGSAAAMLMAARVLHDCGVRLRGRLQIALVSDEEQGGLLGTKSLLDDPDHRPDMVVIGEITANKIAVAEKGIFWTKLTTHGSTAHASTPWEGHSAIADMVYVLFHLQQKWDQEFAAIKHELVPRSSYNIGILQGGIQINTVPDRCEAWIDRRILPDETLQDCQGDLVRFLAKLQAERPGLRLDSEFANEGAAINTDPSSTLVETARRACRLLGHSDELVGYAQASDGRFYVDLGVPIILLGPGDDTLAHAPNECIRTAEVIQAVKIYAVLAALCLGYAPMG